MQCKRHRSPATTSSVACDLFGSASLVPPIDLLPSFEKWMAANDDYRLVFKVRIHSSEKAILITGDIRWP